MPMVTIGLPFYNNQAYLLDTIRSVFAQTYQNWELILVDDGSTDGSLKLAKSIHDARVTVFSDGENKGLAARLNEIAARAAGELCLRLDADDLMHPTRTEKIVEYFETHPSVDALFSGVYEIDESSAVTGYQAVVERHTVQEVLRKFFNPHPTLAGRSWWVRANPYGTRRRAEDLELWCKCFSRTRFGYIDEALYYSRRVSTYSFRKYAATVNDHCKVIMSNGPPLLGLRPTCGLLLKAQLKIGVHVAAEAVGLGPYIARRRLPAVCSSVKKEQDRIIGGILALQLPSDSRGIRVGAVETMEAPGAHRR